jgi:hypothetical protein
MISSTLTDDGRDRPETDLPGSESPESVLKLGALVSVIQSALFVVCDPRPHRGPRAAHHGCETSVDRAGQRRAGPLWSGASDLRFAAVNDPRGYQLVDTGHHPHLEASTTLAGLLTKWLSAIGRSP